MFYCSKRSKKQGKLNARKSAPGWGECSLLPRAHSQPLAFGLPSPWNPPDSCLGLPLGFRPLPLPQLLGRRQRLKILTQKMVKPKLHPPKCQRPWPRCYCFPLGGRGACLSPRPLAPRLTSPTFCSCLFLAHVPGDGYPRIFPKALLSM